jgi:hypothetical protein
MCEKEEDCAKPPAIIKIEDKTKIAFLQFLLTIASFRHCRVALRAPRNNL